MIAPAVAMKGWLATICVGAMLGAGAWAQSAPPAPQNQAQGDAAADPDAVRHGVARLSLMNGAVSVAHGNAGEMTAGVANAPLVTEDRLMTAGNARAELQFDAFNVMRVAPSSEVRLGELEYKHYQIQVAQGLVTFRVLRDNESQVEISTPTVSLHPLRQGIYRVSVDGQGLTEITLRAGEADVESPTGAEPLHAGQTLISRGSISDPEFKTMVAPAPDEWDRWNADRDRPFEAALGSDVSRNVPSDIYGTENLDQYGRWTNDPQYGNVWVPNQGADWAPYQDGRWSDVDYYGWTWISYEPWGWAPYHYGRWFRGGYGWSWYPGAYGRPYYWSPALVGFFGWGSPGFGASFGFGFGNVGWVPLAPFEAYRPWYGRYAAGYAGVRSTAIVNNTNVAGMYRNARFANGVTSMRVGDFGRTGVSGTTMMRASAGDISHASTFSGGGFSGRGVGGGVPIAASRESRSFTSPGFGGGAGGFAGSAGMPRVNNNVRFFSAPSSGGAARAGTGTGASGFAAGGTSSGGSPTGAQGGGWQRFSPSAATGAGSPSRFSGGTNPQAGGAGQGFSRGPAAQGASPNGGSQPVRIAPPIVNNRPGFNQGNAAPRSAAPSGSFGGPRPNTGGGGFSAPRAPTSGARSTGGGGHASGGGGHGGHR